MNGSPSMLAWIRRIELPDSVSVTVHVVVAAVAGAVGVCALLPNPISTFVAYSDRIATIGWTEVARRVPLQENEQQRLRRLKEVEVAMKVVRRDPDHRMRTPSIVTGFPTISGSAAMRLCQKSWLKRSTVRHAPGRG